MRAWSASVEDALHAWVVVGSKLPTEKVIWSQQNGPRPEAPYIAMRCAVMSQPGFDWLDTEDADVPSPGREVVHRVRGPRIAMLELQCFAEATDSSGLVAHAILSDVIASGDLPSVREGLRQAKIGLSTAEAVQFLGTTTDKVNFEPRALTRVMMHLANEVTEPGTYIETVRTVNELRLPMAITTPPVHAERLIHVRTTGDDNSPSGGPTEPLASFLEAVRRFPPDRLYYERWVIDVTGITEEPGVRLEVLTPRSASPNDFIDPQFGTHRTDFFRPPILVRAAPSVEYTIDTGDVSVVVEATHGLIRVTDSSATWTVDEHKGRFLLDGTFGVNPMPILSNTTDTLIVAGNTNPLVAPIEILDVGATFRFGRDTLIEPLFFLQSGFQLQADCGIMFQWIAFERPAGNPSTTIRSRGNGLGSMSFYACRIKDGVFAQGSNNLNFDGCYVDGGFFGMNGLHDQAVNLRNIAFDGVTFTGHDSNYFCINSRFEGCSSFGAQITSQYIGNVDIQNCDIQNSTGDGVLLRGSNQHRIQDTVISGCSGDAVSIDGPQRLRMIDVQGSGNTGHGLMVRNGAQVEVSGGTGVTGAGGDIDAGGALGTQLWSAVPISEDTPATDIRVHT